MNNLQTPDLVQEIVGYRAWGVTHVGRIARLTSVIQPESIWPTNRMLLAKCPSNPDADEGHPVPNERCSCGIYAAIDRDHLLELGYGQYQDPSDVRVFGEVALSGKVILAEKGYRAAKARVNRLYVPHTAWRLVRALEAYQVPIGLGNPFPKEKD
jgi:hypothetical protein